MNKSYLEVLFKCTLCTSSTSILPDKSTFLRHMKEVHLNTGLNHSCTHCDLRFANRRDLQNHAISYHSTPTNTRELRTACSPPQTKYALVTSCSEIKNGSSNYRPMELQSRLHVGADEVRTSVHHLLASESIHQQSAASKPATDKSNGYNINVAQQDSKNDQAIIEKLDERPVTRNHLDLYGMSPRAGNTACPSLPSEISVKKKDDKLNKSDLEQHFGKYASSISIKGQSFYYCQVCMWKTESDDNFHCHFNSEEHIRTVQKLETPWQDEPNKAMSTSPPFVGTNRTVCADKTAVKLANSLSTSISGNIEGDDFECALSDSEAEAISTSFTNQSNKRKQSMPVAVRRPHDTSLDISLDSFGDSILDIDMYSDAFYESLEACVASQGPDVQVKEEPDDSTRKHRYSKEKQTTEMSMFQHSTSSETESLKASLPSSFSIFSTSGAQLSNASATYRYPDPRAESDSHDPFMPDETDSTNQTPGATNSVKRFDSSLFEARAEQQKKNSHLSLVNILVEILPSFLETCLPPFDHTAPNRTTILQIAAEILQNSSALSWKSDCDKAVKKAFPNCKVKRKGPPRAKTTQYYGIKLIREFEDSLTTASRLRVSGSQLAVSSPHPLQKKAKISVSPFGEITFLGSPAEHCSELRRCNNLQMPISVRNFQSPVDTKPSTKTVRPIPDSGIGSLMHLAKFITLYPGPFVTARNVCQKYKTSTGHAPHIDTAIEAMTLLQTFGLGEYMCMDNGWTKVFFKVIPSSLTEENSSNVNVKRAVYQAIFSERDCKLDTILHDKLKKAYTEKSSGLVEFYPH